MSVDPVVLALRAALARGDSAELRVALGEHLLRKTDAQAALAEFEAGLALDPSHGPALDGAARAADAAGDSARALAYRLALGGSAPSKPAAASAPLPALGPVITAPSTPPPLPPREPQRTESEARPALRLVAEAGELLEEDAAPVTRFDDVGGMDDVKERLTRSFLMPLKNPELFRKFGKRIGGGLVLYGPPGCGKTFVARAVAGEIGARFMNVGLSDVLDMWFGESERKLHELFDNARRRAPCVVFFDEVDAIGQRRSQLKGSAGRTLVNQLLSELDGVDGKNDDVFFLAATNHPWDLDPALRRPGRLDRLVFVPPPDAAARARILQLKLSERPHVPTIDLVRLAKSTDGFSGADLSALVDGATELAIEKSVQSGTETPIDEALLARALKDLRPSTRPWFETARNYALYANEGGSYDDLLAHLKRIGLA